MGEVERLEQGLWDISRKLAYTGASLAVTPSNVIAIWKAAMGGGVLPPEDTTFAQVP